MSAQPLSEKAPGPKGTRAQASGVKLPDAKILDGIVLDVKVLIVAAEASSELYARRIFEEVKKRNLGYRFFGVGSAAMVGQGLDAIERSENMAVVGIWEVLNHWPVISTAFKKLVQRASQERPQVALLLDYPDFNLRLARKLHHLKIPVVYFISPQIWAWRTGRVHVIKKIISRMLVVFPFETDFYKKFDVPVTFVGHPLLDEIALSKLTPNQRREGRAALNVDDANFLVGLLPGSRDSELKYNFQTQLQAAQVIAQKKPGARFLILVAPSLEVEKIKALIPQDFKLHIKIIKDDPLRVMQLCDACIVASGTATLMTALSETPMVIMYKMNGATAFIAKRLVSGAFFGMPNLILGERAVPELFQEEASADNLAGEVMKYEEDINYFNATKAKLALIKEKLGNGGVASRVVDELEKIVTPGRR